MPTDLTIWNPSFTRGHAWTPGFESRRWLREHRAFLPKLGLGALVFGGAQLLSPDTRLLIASASLVLAGAAGLAWHGSLAWGRFCDRQAGLE